VLCALLLMLSCSRPAAPPPGTRDVLLIVVDTLRRDHTSTYGYARQTTPSLSALAAEGVRYDGAVSAAPWTLPSMSAILTGALPSTLGVVRHDSLLPDEATLMSEVLAEQGWATGAVSSHSFFSPEHNLQQGFDELDTDNIRGHREETSAGVTDAAIRFLRRHRSEPVFLVVHYFDPHFAWIRHDSDDDDDDDDDDDAYRGPVTAGMPIKELRARAGGLSAADWAAVRRLYDDEVRHTDAHIGRLLAALAAEGRSERALVAVTGDHGESFYEHGHLGHTIELYDTLVAAPLVVRYPVGLGPPAGSVASERVSLMDLPATIAEVTGVDDPSGGHSLLHPEPDRVVRSETLKGADLRAVVGERHKLIWDRAADEWLLFDLLTDPGEAHNRYTEADPAVLVLRPHIRRWGAAGGAAGAAALSEESLRRLEELGYISRP
jgi:arylsulfatase A-like enzyme